MILVCWIERGARMTITESTSVATAGLFSSGVIWMLAQAQPIVNALPEGTGTAIAGLTGGSFCIWYSWYITTRVLPEKDRLHAETIKEIVSDFREEMKTHRESTERLFDTFRNQS